MTLEQVKNYLRIDFNDDDTFISTLIEISQIYIESCVGTDYKTNSNLLKLAEIAQLKLINNMYSNRDTSTTNFKQDITITTIFDVLANQVVVI